VNIINLHLILRRFQDIAVYGKILAVDWRYLSLTRSFGASPWIHDFEIWHQETEDIVLL